MSRRSARGQGDFSQEEDFPDEDFPMIGGGAAAGSLEEAFGDGGAGHHGRMEGMRYSDVAAPVVSSSKKRPRGDEEEGLV